MKIKNIISIAALFVIGLCACQNKDFLYQDTARVRLEADEIWSLGTDSLSFSFTITDPGTRSQDIDIDAVIMGTVSDKDRIVNISANKEKTTADASLYSFPAQVTIPARQSSATFQVTLNRSAELEQKEVRLYIEVVPSNDFQPGVKESNHVLIKWNDKITRPTNWDSLKEYFGTYSDTKYRFMLANVPGGTEFSTDKMSWSQLMNYKVQFTNALNEYNAAHPGNPLKDENGVLVDFNN